MPGSTVLVLGCGPIGCFAAGVARAAGAVPGHCQRLTRQRLDLARRMGAHAVTQSIGGGRRRSRAGAHRGDGVDLVCEMSGHPAGHAQAFAAARLGGRVNLLGTPSRTTEVDFARDVIFKGLTLYGVTGRKMYEHLAPDGVGSSGPGSSIRARSSPTASRSSASPTRSACIKDGQAGKVILEIGDMTLATSVPWRRGSKPSWSSSGGTASTSGSTISTARRDARVRMEGRGEVIILSSNNYLGLSDQPEVVAAGKAALDRFGAGTASVRFICGTFTVHRELEAACAAARRHRGVAQLRELLERQRGGAARCSPSDDLVLSDQLNHASIIDGHPARQGDHQVPDRRLPARRPRRSRREARAPPATAGCKMVITDGVFSMEGAIASCPTCVELCRKHGAVLVVDDSHATGVLGATGRGTAEHFGMLGEVDIITSTLGKALGGAAGGFVAGSAAVCDYLTQRARPQLFSNALPPTVAASALASVEYLEAHPERVTRLRENARYFREQLLRARLQAARRARRPSSR